MLNRRFVPFPILATERLILRQLVINDEQEIFILRSDREINKYLDRQVSNTIDDARDFINKINENINKNDSLYWAITLGDRNILVGTICLFSFSDEDGNCEIGYELLTNFQGQGIMKEAAEKVVDYAFNTIKVQKIEAIFHRDNQRSINLLEKLLFRNSNESDKTNPELICYHLRNPFDNLNKNSPRKTEPLTPGLLPVSLPAGRPASCCPETSGSPINK
jgi:ribosomal-protein-alanine N-acetyltransferase